MMEESESLAILRRHQHEEGPLLPVLHDMQDAWGHIPDSAVPVIAEFLNLSRAEVHGTISFYHDFRRTPPPGPVLKLCRAEACQARGADRIAAALEAVDRISVEPIYCLGLCASGPSAMIGKQVFARLDEEGAIALAKEAAR